MPLLGEAESSSSSAHAPGSGLGRYSSQLIFCVFVSQVCVRLGWRPPEQRGEYDILPLVLQAQGGEAQMFEIPRDLVIEVELQHPQSVTRPRCCLATTHFLLLPF